SCMPGTNSSARMTSAIAPPIRNMTRLNTRYIVPMSLWLVVVSHRVMPFAGPWSSWWSAAWPWVWVALIFQLLRNGDAHGRHLVNRGNDGGGLRRRGGRRLARGLLRGEPRVEVGLRLHLDHHRHEAVVAAAELGAL